MEKEKIEKVSASEQKEEGREIQRLELDPEKKIDIVIKNISGRAALSDSPFLVKVVLEQDGKIIEDFQEEAADIKFSACLPKFPEFSNIVRWRYEDEIKQVVMPAVKWDNGSKDILSFLHELGHGIYHTKYPEEHERERNLLQLEEETESEIFTMLECISDEDKEKYIDNLKRITEERVLLTAKQERGAWAESLKLIRKIKREKSIDLLRPLRGKTPNETRENLDRFIHGSISLGSSERDLRKKIKERGLNQELKGIFTKKYKGEIEEISKEVSEKASKI